MDALIAVFLFFLGAVFASFACVIAERLGTGDSWHRGRSKCNACARELSPFDLVPVLSYLLFRGRCRTCTSKIPAQYSLIEFSLGALYALLYWRYGFSELLVAYLAFLFILAVLVVYDLRHTIVPFKLSLALVLLGAIIAVLSATSLHALAVTFIVSGTIATFFYALHVVSSGQWMGLGDTPIALSLSLATGVYAVTGLLFSFWSGALIGVLILVLTSRGRTMKREVPFVPFLAFGYFLALLLEWNILVFI